MKKWIRYTVVFVLIIANSTAKIWGQSKDQLEKERKTIIKEIERTNQYLKTTQKEKSSTLTDIKAIEKQVKDRESLIQTVKKEITSADAIILSNEVQKDSIVVAYKRLVAQYKSVLRYAYHDALSNQKLSYLLSSESLNTFLIRYRYIKQFESYQRAKKNELNDLRVKIEETTKNIQKTKEEQAYLLKLEQDQYSKLQGEKKKKDQALLTINKKESDLKNDLNRKNKEREKLNSAIEAIIIAQLKTIKEEKVTNPTRNTVGTKLNSLFSQNKGGLPWPVNNGFISTRFGKQAHPTLKGITIESNGVDISCNAGSTVQCVFDGEVVGIAKIVGSDHMIIISHGSYYTVYSNVGNITVSKGQSIKRGQSIGSSGTNDSGKGEVHFEIWQDKNKLNPESWIRR